MKFEIIPKESVLHIRIPSALMDAVRAKAAAKGIPYSRYIRMVLEADIGSSQIAVKPPKIIARD